MVNQIYASKANEHAFEHWVGGEAHGAMTFFLASELRRARAAATYREVMDNVIGKVNALYPQQHPQLAFDRAHLRRSVGSVEAEAAGEKHAAGCDQPGDTGGDRIAHGGGTPARPRPSVLP